MSWRTFCGSIGRRSTGCSETANSPHSGSAVIGGSVATLLKNGYIPGSVRLLSDDLEESPSEKLNSKWGSFREEEIRRGLRTLREPVIILRSPWRSAAPRVSNLTTAPANG